MRAELGEGGERSSATRRRSPPRGRGTRSAPAWSAPARRRKRIRPAIIPREAAGTAPAAPLAPQAAQLSTAATPCTTSAARRRGGPASPGAPASVAAIRPRAAARSPRPRRADQSAPRPSRGWCGRRRPQRAQCGGGPSRALIPTTNAAASASACTTTNAAVGTSRRPRARTGGAAPGWSSSRGSAAVEQSSGVPASPGRPRVGGHARAEDPVGPRLGRSGRSASSPPRPRSSP